MKVFARAQLPKTAGKNTLQKEHMQSKESQSILQSTHLPELRLPNFSDIHLPKHKTERTIVPTKQKTNSKHEIKMSNIKNMFHVKNPWTKVRGVFGFLNTSRILLACSRTEVRSLRKQNSLSIKKVSFPNIHAPHLELPKIALPQINRSESHSPRHKLPSFREIGQKISHIHMPHPHLPKISIPHPRFKAAHIRKILHLPKFHPVLYLERIKKHIPEIHISEYVNTVIDHIPRIHPSEYYVSIKENARVTWEKIHPLKATKEEIALQAELANEQAQETQEPPENLESEEEILKKDTEKKPQAPKPILITPEKYWIEYKPRNHAQKIEHHFAYEIDDVHHIKNILRKHHKPGLI